MIPRPPSSIASFARRSAPLALDAASLFSVLRKVVNRTRISSVNCFPCSVSKDSWLLTAWRSSRAIPMIGST